MRTLRYDQFGEAEQVVKLADLPAPGGRGPGGRAVCAAGLPGLLSIGGHVAPPRLPAVAGNEGVAGGGGR
jgi:hypothetical protein